MGEIAKEVLAKHEPLLSRFYVTLHDVKKEYETSQDWKKMQKEEGEDYEGVGFRYSDLEAFYSDCIYKMKKSGPELVDIKDEDLEETMNTVYDNLSDDEKSYLKKYKISVGI